MSDYRVVYLIVERRDPEQPAFWRMAGSAFVCRDGSLNMRLDLFPGLCFNIREPKSNGERDESKEAPGDIGPKSKFVPRRIPKEVLKDEDIPF